MERRKPDYYLLGLCMGLLSFGLVVLYSASSIFAHQKYGSSTYFLKKQLVWVFLGGASLLTFSKLDYNRLKEWIRPALGMTCVLLFAALFTMPVGGARRWIRLGPIGIQPAEVAKLCLVIYLADYIDRRRSRLHLFKEGLLPPLAVLGFILGLIMLEPDLGNPILMMSVAGLMLIAGGIRLAHVGALILGVLPLLAYQLIFYPYRRQRMLAFLSPFSHAQGSGYQVVQALFAVGSGGWFGKGLGASQLKLLYLPAPHTDFIFPVLCEELGLLGSISVVVLFFMFLIRGFKIARSAPNLFGCLLATGLTLLIGLQAYFNIAVSIGLLPNKGLPLPFFSFGGSALLITLTSVGILLNISKQSRPEAVPAAA